MKTEETKEKRIAAYEQQKLRLEAQLAIVLRKDELVRVLRYSRDEKEAKKRVATNFNLSLRQAAFLLSAYHCELMSLEYNDLQKKYDKVITYLTENNSSKTSYIMANSYAENRKIYLKEYADEKSFPIGGSWQGSGEYDHILKFEEGKNSTESRKNKHKTVCCYNILNGVKTDKFQLEDMHRFAHHLNSSQVLCYNFFRPLITDDNHPTNALVRLLKCIGIVISESAVCKFEYCPDKNEQTQFDFYIKDGATEIFFEIKYTEYGFGKADRDDSHKEKFDEIYTKHLKKQKCLEKLPEFDEFANNYQLYRNAIRLTDKNKHLVLLYPLQNTIVNNQAENFRQDKIANEYRHNVHILHWEDIVDKSTELYQKYFAE